MSQLRDATAEDFESVIQLNTDEVRHTSPMDRERLELLDDLACYHKVAMVDDQVAGFLFAMRETAPYENDNFAWFAERYPQFVYVDRIVIGKAFARMGLGHALYRDLFAFSRSQGVDTLACEYNLDPPNKASQAFHDALGFDEVGTQWVANNSKLVSLQIATC